MTAVAEKVAFDSGGVRCRGWLVKPVHSDTRLPCIVMGHGFGLTVRSGLLPFAEAFAAHGYCVLVFDYRSFGRSEGRPRQVISFRRQLADWQAAIDFALRRSEVDATRIVTWGFSLGGGHALSAAARDPRVAAVTAVAPMLSGLSSTMAAMRWWSLRAMLRISGRGLLDLAVSWLRRRPITVPLAAPPGQIGILTSPDAFSGYRAIVPKDFIFETAARIALYFWSYAPGRRLPRFERPVLIMPSSTDRICPPGPTLRRARRCRTAEIVPLACDHMDVATEPYRSRVVEATDDFLSKHLAKS